MDIIVAGLLAVTAMSCFLSYSLLRGRRLPNAMPMLALGLALGALSVLALAAPSNPVYVSAMTASGVFLTVVFVNNVLKSRSVTPDWLVMALSGMLAISAGIGLIQLQLDAEDQASAYGSGVTDRQLDKAMDTIFDRYLERKISGRTGRVIYDVDDGQISDPDLKESDEILWEYFTAIAVNPDSLNRVEEFRLFGSTSEDLEDVNGFVKALNDDHTRWALGMSYDNSRYASDTTDTLIHEYLHLVTMEDDQILTASEMPGRRYSCDGYDSDGVCFTPTSLLTPWYEQFWVAEGFDLDESDKAVAKRYLLNEDKFVRAYAATNPEEDFVVSATAWILNQPVPEPKQRFIESSPEMFDLKRDIRQAIIAHAG